MKTKLLLLATWLASMAAVAQSPIGSYSMSLWAHTNLNVNRALETGEIGRAIGYISNGIVSTITIPSTNGFIGDAPLGTSLYARSNANWQVFTIPSTNGFIPEAPPDGQTYGRRGSDASWQLMPGGSDTNAVAAVADLATLTNSVVNRTKALVGKTDDATWTAWQLVPSGGGSPAQTFTNLSTAGGDWDEGFGSCLASGQNFQTNITWRVTVQDCNCPTVYNLIASEFGASYQFDGYIFRAVNSAPAALVEAPNTSGFTLLAGSTNIVESTRQYIRFQFVALATNALSVAVRRGAATGGLNDYTINDVSFTKLAVTGYEPNGSNILASAAIPGYAWKKVYTESQGGSVTEALVMVADSTAVFPTNTKYVRFQAPTGLSITLTNNNVIPDGSADFTSFFLYDTYYGDLGSVRIPQDTNGTDGVGSNVKMAEGTGDVVMVPRTFYTYRFDSAQSLWILGAENNLVAQDLPADVKDSLIVQLLPWALTNYARLFPHGPMVGTPANPISLPDIGPRPMGGRDIYAPAPLAPRSSPVYNVEINVGPQNEPTP